MTDELDARRATGIVHALAGDVDSQICDDCGRTVDVSDATTPRAVITVLVAHSNEHHGEGSE